MSEVMKKYDKLDSLLVSYGMKSFKEAESFASENENKIEYPVTTENQLENHKIKIEKLLETQEKENI
jgi:hypothetical protein